MVVDVASTILVTRNAALNLVNAYRYQCLSNGIVGKE
jgi:hypothetical protein